MNKIGDRDDFVALVSLECRVKPPPVFSGERAAAHRLVCNMNHKNHLTAN